MDDLSVDLVDGGEKLLLVLVFVGDRVRFHSFGVSEYVTNPSVDLVGGGEKSLLVLVFAVMGFDSTLLASLLYSFYIFFCVRVQFHLLLFFVIVFNPILAVCC